MKEHAVQQGGASGGQRGVRLWPGVVAVALQWGLRFVVQPLAPADYDTEAAAAGMIGALLLGLVVLLWWVFFSRVPRGERWSALGLVALALAGTWFLADHSISHGMMGLLLFIYAAPFVSLALVLAALLRSRSPRAARTALVGVLLLGCGVWALVRTEGMTGSARSSFFWRWTPTAEQRLLAAGEAAATQSASGAETSAAVDEAILWSGFRGGARNSVVEGTRLSTDWVSSPPVELWRRGVGPGWSSFSVAGTRIYTQEQRGEEELVACYDLSTGAPVWTHADETRFWESNAGAGPRATPTLHEGRVYTLGATGRVNALDARDGSLLWSSDAASETGASLPDWGFSGSPWVADGRVYVAASGALLAYAADSGEVLWRGPAGAGDGTHPVSYSSPQLVEIDGVPQVLLSTADSIDSYALEGGAALWRYAWAGFPITQPVQLAGGDLLVSVNNRDGTRRLSARRDGESWSVEEHWSSNRMKPYFNDLVVHEEHAYGFDKSILACIELESGSRVWKGGRYGYGQVLLLPDQDLLLVLSEQGELALVEARPDGYTELARTAALEGKTWNHPVLVGDVLLVRNAEEMAAFRVAQNEG